MSENELKELQTALGNLNIVLSDFIDVHKFSQDEEDDRQRNSEERNIRN